MSEPLWRPSAERIAASNLSHFMAEVERRWGVATGDYDALWQWSIEQPERFWQSLWDFAEVRAETRGQTVLADRDRLPGARFFPEARLNFAENLLRRRDDGEAIVFQGEQAIRRRLSWAELYDQVAGLAQALAAVGVTKGDRVVGFLPNMPETIIAMLATASLGAVWSSCSPDFGIRGVLDRFGQIAPKVLFTADGYFYNGTRHDSLARIAGIVAELTALEAVVVVPYTRDDPPVTALGARARLFADFVAPQPGGEIGFVACEFNHPLYIMYS
ncbi:MAG: AMP-binding protein, partial [Kiloniellales bacterium]